MKARLIGAALALAALPHAVRAADTPNPSGRTTADIVAQLETYAAPEMAKAGIPGMAYAVVKDGAVVFAKGYGKRAITDAADNVTTETLFEIGSTSKAFTAALIGMLVDEGKLTWSDRVVDHLPDFKLYDPWVTREFRVIDLLCQRSGMPGYSLDMMSMIGFGRADIEHAMRYVEPTYSFRGGFAYVNHLWLTAARLFEKLDGRTWEEALAARIFQPVGMRESTTDSQLVALVPDRARGHLVKEDLVTLRPEPDEWAYKCWLDVYGPAGSIRSTVGDMAKWMTLHLARGSLGTSRLLSERTVLALHAPRTVPPGGPDPSTGIRSSAYALGWMHEELPFGTIVWHNGGTAGQHSIVALYETAQVGLVVLTNEPSNQLPEKMRYVLYNLLFVPPGGQPIPLTRVVPPEMAPPPPEARVLRPLAPIPPLPLERYVGIYENPAFGRFEVKVNESGLVLVMGPNRVEGILTPWSGNVFRLRFPDFFGQDSNVTFTVPAGGAASKFAAAKMPEVKGGVFTRVP